ncbi:MAG: hypothetical protein BAJATHORv1_30129 [Candidatus Thorarchaeota archaeon]|nr:MAG: hypothetical protein BAJATHORv1_30129 [Candidatus Thorarchaeota archaeon]
MVDRFPRKLDETLGILETPKFMATKSNDNEPNVAFVTTWTRYDEKRLVYGDFLTQKTKRNLEDGNHELGLLIMTTDLDNWMIQADFSEFHKNDEVYEFIAMTPLFRYSQYTNARMAGTAIPTEVSENYRISKLSVLTSYLRARLSARKIPRKKSKEGNMPLNVYERFTRVDSVKVISYIGSDGYPRLFPEFGVYPASKNRLTIIRNQERKRGLIIQDGFRVAISLVTLEPAVFQVKGTFREIDSKLGFVELDRVYTCSLPRPGLRIDLPLIDPK